MFTVVAAIAAARPNPGSAIAEPRGIGPRWRGLPLARRGVRLFSELRRYPRAIGCSDPQERIISWDEGTGKPLAVRNGVNGPVIVDSNTPGVTAPTSVAAQSQGVIEPSSRPVLFPRRFPAQQCFHGGVYLLIGQRAADRHCILPRRRGPAQQHRRHGGNG